MKKMLTRVKRAPLNHLPHPENPWFRHNGTLSDFWLTQPIDRRTGLFDQQPDAFNRVFTLPSQRCAEYEGNIAELSFLEFGPKKKTLTKRGQQVTFDGTTRTVWFVGQDRTLDESIGSFTEWLNLPDEESKAPTGFREHFTGTPPEHRKHHVAWWAFRAPVMFTLDENVADELLDTIRASI